MITKYKPTAGDLRIIRDCAGKDAGRGYVTINGSSRYNINDNNRKAPDGGDLNIAFVSDDPDFGDTDLEDNDWSWDYFARGVLLKDGVGVFDFWVYDRHTDELLTNVTAYYRDGALDRVEGVVNGTMWSRS